MGIMQLDRIHPKTRVLIFIGLGLLIFALNMKNLKGDGDGTVDAQVQLFNGTADDDPKLVEYVKTKRLISPSTAPYNLSNANVIDESQYGQPKIIDKLLHNMSNGFFVEVGAHDGESLSNSLYFERFRNWNGLLIEANGKLFQRLLSKNRKAYSVNACLSLHPVAEILNFHSPGNDDFLGRINPQGKTSIQCFPFYTLMLALGRSHVDYFSLDIEGDELNVLKTIPWDKFQFTLLDVEIAHIAEGKQAVIDYMKGVGYTLIQQHAIDLIFAKKELLDKIVK